MVETIFVDYLSSYFPNTTVVCERPTGTIPDSYILIDNTGTSKSNHIYQSRVAFQSYGKTLYDAATLNDSVIAAVEASVSQASVASVRLNSAYNFSDTASKTYRYQAVFDITHY